MKKFLNISLLALVSLSSILLTSCLHEMDEVFDEDAVIRMNNAMAEYEDILTSNGGKWLLEYFANTSEPGYNYVLTFAKDGTVVMSGHNKWIQYIKNKTWTSGFGSEVSMWDVIGDNGLVLTFNSYNNYFHLFSTPDAVPTQGGTSTAGGASTAGKGHEGDYEFNLMKYSGDTIYLTGKKYNLHMIMTRLPQNTDDETYLNQVASYNNTNTGMFTSKLNNVYIVLPDGKRWVVKSAATGNMQIYPEGSDEVMTSEYHNFIITNDGMAFRDVLTLEGNTPDVVYRVQRFVRQADGTALSVEDHQTLITADPLFDCLLNTTYSWTTNFKNDAAGGLFSTLAAQITAESKKTSTGGDGTSLSNAKISYVDSLSTFALTLNFSKSGRTFPAIYTFTATSPGNNQIKMTFEGMYNYGARYKSMCPSLVTLLDLMGSSTFELSSPSLLSPVKITMTQSGDPANFVVWSL